MKHTERLVDEVALGDPLLVELLGERNVRVPLLEHSVALSVVMLNVCHDLSSKLNVFRN
jgi:hypothetical protein